VSHHHHPFATSSIPQWESTLVLLPPPSAAAATTTTFSFPLHHLSHKSFPPISALDSAFPPLIVVALLFQGLCYATTYHETFISWRLIISCVLLIWWCRGHWRQPQHPLVNISQGAEVNDCNDHSSFFVKVYMEGIPIGRKLNILAHGGYYELVRTLEHMFDTTILCESAALYQFNFFYF